MGFDEVTSLQYFHWEDLFRHVKPYQCLMDVPEGFEACNFELKPGPPQTIEDIRGNEHHFDLDVNGFCIRKRDSRPLILSRQYVEDEYFEEVKQLIKTTIDGVEEVQLFDWRVIVILTIGQRYAVSLKGC